MTLQSSEHGRSGMGRTVVVDLTGQRFGRLLALVRHREPGRGSVTTYECSCECENFTTVQHGNLRVAISCGCHRHAVLTTVNITHGLSHTRTWNSWRAMRERCLVETSKDYKRYGARGISVCDRWACSFENFFADMGERPPETTIERKDNDGNYEPSNCMWGTPIQQGNNKRNNTFIDFGGKHMTLAQWARELKVSPECLLFRLKQWGSSRALTTVGVTR